MLTIDTYYLTVALEYGVLGFILYFGAFLFAVGGATRYVLAPFDRRNREAGFLLPAGICLINFVVIKSVFAQQDNHPLVFMVLGMALALTYRIRKEGAPRLGDGSRSDEFELARTAKTSSGRTKLEGEVVA